jgi:hypothetical protein
VAALSMIDKNPWPLPDILISFYCDSISNFQFQAESDYTSSYLTHDTQSLYKPLRQSSQPMLAEP